MNVRLAVQIFSHSTAVALRTYVKYKLLPVEALDTAEFIENINELWDYLNCCKFGDFGPKAPFTRENIAQRSDRLVFFTILFLIVNF